jgi:hypothetical protein
MRNGWFENEAERKAFYAKQEAFWNRPSDEVMADLVAVPRTQGSVRPHTVAAVVPQVQPSTNVVSFVDWRATHKRIPQ